MIMTINGDPEDLRLFGKLIPPMVPTVCYGGSRFVQPIQHYFLHEQLPTLREINPDVGTLRVRLDRDCVIELNGIKEDFIGTLTFGHVLNEEELSQIPGTQESGLVSL